MKILFLLRFRQGIVPIDRFRVTDFDEIQNLALCTLFLNSYHSIGNTYF